MRANSIVFLDPLFGDISDCALATGSMLWIGLDLSELFNMAVQRRYSMSHVFSIREELGDSDIELTEENIRRAYRMQVTSMWEFLRNLLELDGIFGYEEIVVRQFSEYMGRYPFDGNRIRFLRGVQSIFLQKRCLELADFYDPPLDSFGEDAVDCCFEQGDIEELLSLSFLQLHMPLMLHFGPKTLILKVLKA